MGGKSIRCEMQKYVLSVECQSDTGDRFTLGLGQSVVVCSVGSWPRHDQISSHH